MTTEAALRQIEKALIQRDDLILTQDELLRRYESRIRLLEEILSLHGVSIPSGVEPAEVQLTA